MRRSPTCPRRSTSGPAATAPRPAACASCTRASRCPAGRVPARPRRRHWARCHAATRRNERGTACGRRSPGSSGTRAALRCAAARVVTGLRNSSTTPSRAVATTTALRSLTAVITLPSRSSAIPSTPSSPGCCTKTLPGTACRRERRVAAGRAAHVPAAIELDAPDRAARGVADEQRAVAVEREPVRDECWEPSGSKPAGRVRDRHGRGRRRARVAPHPAGHGVVDHRLDAEHHLRDAVAPDPPHTALAGSAVGDPELAALVERDAVGAGMPAANTVATGGLEALGRKRGSVRYRRRTARPGGRTPGRGGCTAQAGVPTVTPVPPPAGTRTTGTGRPRGAPGNRGCPWRRRSGLETERVLWTV